MLDKDGEITIRSETPDDYEAIRELLAKAFDGPAEGRLVDSLRTMPGFDSRLSLVALLKGQIVGHVLFSSIRIVNDDSTTPAIALAPMAVRPEFQRKGIGGAIVDRGLAECRRLGHRIAVVLGHSDYYPGFGFVPASREGILAPFDVPDEAFMAVELVPGALIGVNGTVRYPPPFESL